MRAVVRANAREAREALEASATAALQTVATACGSTPIMRPGQYYAHITTEPCLTIFSLSADLVRFDSFTCTPDQAIAIVRTLRVPKG